MSFLINPYRYAAIGGGGPFAGPEFIAAGSIVGAGTASQTVTLPAHQTDDILIVVAHNPSNITITTPTSGWASIAASAGGVYDNWFWKRATSSSETAPTVTSTGNTNTLACAYTFRGCVTSGDPFEDATVATYVADHTTPDTASIDTLGADRLAVSFLVRFDDVTWSVSPPPSGWTLEDDQVTTLRNDGGFTVISKEMASAGNVPAIEIGTYNAGNSFWKTLTLALIPD
jgi:hypothetical protein